MSLFGWIETVWCIVMIPAMVVLLLAERRAASAPMPSTEGEGPLAADLGKRAVAHRA